MKNLVLLVFSCSLISGCFPSRPHEFPGGVSLLGIDFTEYTDSGFIFTPESYPGAFESIGIVRVEIRPHMYRVDGNASAKLGSQYRDFQTANEEAWRIEILNTQQALRSAYEQAIALGANALSSFDISEEEDNTQFISYKYLVVSGFAIRRLN